MSKVLVGAPESGAGAVRNLSDGLDPNIVTAGGCRSVISPSTYYR